MSKPFHLPSLKTVFALSAFWLTTSAVFGQEQVVSDSTAVKNKSKELKAKETAAMQKELDSAYTYTGTISGARGSAERGLIKAYKAALKKFNQPVTDTPARALTSGETEMLRDVFGNVLDLNGITISVDGTPNPVDYSSFIGDELVIYGGHLGSKDYSQEGAFKKELIIAAFTSQLQSQIATVRAENAQNKDYRTVDGENGAKLNKYVSQTPYYTLDPKKRFEDYNSAQQVSMVVDYYRVHKMDMLPQYDTRCRTTKMGTTSTGSSYAGKNILKKMVETYITKINKPKTGTAPKAPTPGGK